MAPPDEEENEEMLPDVRTCQRLTESFAEITSTDEACAQFFLQDHQWKLEPSLEAFFKAQEAEQVKNPTQDGGGDSDQSDQSSFGGRKRKSEEDSPELIDLSSLLDDEDIPDPDEDGVPDLVGQKAFPSLKGRRVDPPMHSVLGSSAPSRKKKPRLQSGSTSSMASSSTSSSVAGRVTGPTLKVLSWNLDGLCEKNLGPRTRAAIEEIKQEDPDVVMLQELVPMTFSMFSTTFSSTFLIRHGAQDDRITKEATAPAKSYFTAILLKKTRFDSNLIPPTYRTLPFRNSIMNRTLLIAETHLGNRPLCIMTSHLESTKDYGKERKEQLTRAFNEIKNLGKKTTCVFAGDLNLRDSEVSEVGLPNNVVDVWEATGASDVFRYTWDSMRNSNIGMRGPRLRFDRMYLKSNSNASPLLQPLMFGLVGIVKVRETQSFPSDHWGIRALFQVNE